MTQRRVENTRDHFWTCSPISVKNKLSKNYSKMFNLIKVGTECAKLDKWLLDDIDTKMTVLGTELLIGVSFLVECFSSAEEEAVN